MWGVECKAQFNKVCCLGFGVLGLGVQGLGFRVWDLGFGI